MNQLSLLEAEEFYEFPKDLLEYQENFLSRKEADELKDQLLKTAPWEQRTQKMYDKTVITPRLTAWYGIYHLMNQLMAIQKIKAPGHPNFMT